MEDHLKEFKLTPKVRQKLKDKTLLKEELEAGKTAQEILEFSDMSMAKFYGASYKLFEHQRFEDASNAFLFLATLNPYNYDYWVGLGMSLQMLGDYELAIDAYEMAAICQVDNPVPYFYLAKCLFAIHDRESALQALDLAVEYSSEHAEYSEMLIQALKAKDLLNQMEHPLKKKRTRKKPKSELNE